VGNPGLYPHRLAGAFDCHDRSAKRHSRGGQFPRRVTWIGLLVVVLLDRTQETQRGVATHCLVNRPERRAYRGSGTIDAHNDRLWRS
jgi:hypothetical protein